MAENITTKHKPADDGGIFCRYENDDTGQTNSFYLDEPPCPESDTIEFSQSGSQLTGFSKGRVSGRFGGGRFSGGSQGQISRGFGSRRGSDLVTGLGGSQIMRARAGRSVSYNPLYNKPKYVVSASMRELRRRKAQSQRPMLKFGVTRTR